MSDIWARNKYNMALYIHRVIGKILTNYSILFQDFLQSIINLHKINFEVVVAQSDTF